MGKCILGEVREASAHLLHNVVGCGFAFRHHIAGKVRNSAEQLVQLLLGGGKLVGNLLLSIFERAHLSLGGIGFVDFFLFHKSADRGGKLIKLGSLCVVVELELTATVVERKHLMDGFLSVETLYSQLGDSLFGVGFDLLNGKHIIRY